MVIAGLALHVLSSSNIPFDRMHRICFRHAAFGESLRFYAINSASPVDAVPSGITLCTATTGDKLLMHILRRDEGLRTDAVYPNSPTVR